MNTTRSFQKRNILINHCARWFKIIFDGSMKNLVSFIIEEKDLDADELGELLAHYKKEEE